MKKVLLFALAGAAVGLVAHLDTKNDQDEQTGPSFLDRVVANLEKLPPVIAIVAEHFASQGNPADAAEDGEKADGRATPEE